jgi:hypothetical protein
MKGLKGANMCAGHSGHPPVCNLQNADVNVQHDAHRGLCAIRARNGTRHHDPRPTDQSLRQWSGHTRWNFVVSTQSGNTGARCTRSPLHHQCAPSNVENQNIRIHSVLTPSSQSKSCIRVSSETPSWSVFRHLHQIVFGSSCIHFVTRYGAYG